MTSHLLEPFRRPTPKRPRRVARGGSAGWPGFLFWPPPGSSGPPHLLPPIAIRRAGGGVDPRAAIAITRRDQVLYVRGYGHDADDVPITDDTRFRIASLSKSFTSLAVLQLVDAGRVSLDDPVVGHLPEFRLADPRGADITVRQPPIPCPVS